MSFGLTTTRKSARQKLGIEKKSKDKAGPVPNVDVLPQKAWVALSEALTGRLGFTLSRMAMRAQSVKIGGKIILLRYPARDRIVNADVARRTNARPAVSLTGWNAMAWRMDTAPIATMLVNPQP